MEIPDLWKFKTERGKANIAMSFKNIIFKNKEILIFDMPSTKQRETLD